MNCRFLIYNKKWNFYSFSKSLFITILFILYICIFMHFIVFVFFLIFCIFVNPIQYDDALCSFNSAIQFNSMIQFISGGAGRCCAGRMQFDCIEPSN